MIRRILLPLDPSPYTVSAMEYASRLALRYDADITALGILDTPGIESSVGATPIGGMHFSRELYERWQSEAYEHMRTMVEEARNRCETHHVHYSILQRHGNPEEIVLAESRYHDVVISGLRSYLHFETEPDAGKRLDKALGKSITPIIGVPEKADFPEGGELRVLVAYDGSLPSARALQHFIHRIGNSIGEVTIVTSNSDIEEATKFLDDAEGYLKAHGVEKVRKEWTTSAIVDVIEEKYLEQNDIIVLGAHSKKGLVDFMVGSLAKHLLKKSTIPVFLGQ